MNSLCSIAFILDKARNLLIGKENDKLLEWSKLKAFADGIKLIKKMNFVVDGVENIMGQAENAGYQHFLLFPQCF